MPYALHLFALDRFQEVSLLGTALAFAWLPPVFGVFQLPCAPNPICAYFRRIAPLQRNGNKVVLHFEYVGGGLDTFDVRTPIGFTLAGNDEVFHPAKATIVGKDRIEVWSDAVPNPIAARYAWADNPVCNVQNREGLPLTPFRTDEFKMVTDGQ